VHDENVKDAKTTRKNCSYVLRESCIYADADENKNPCYSCSSGGNYKENKELYHYDAHGAYADLVKAAEDFIGKCDSGGARSVDSYNKFKNALIKIERG